MYYYDLKLTSVKGLKKVSSIEMSLMTSVKYKIT
jgi:hypothetical protein